MLTLPIVGMLTTANSSPVKTGTDTLHITLAEPLKVDAGQSIPVALTTQSEKDWTDYLSAVLTPIVAILAIWIAYRQHKTQQYQVRLDLFERRIKIIEDVRRVLTDIDKYYSGEPQKIDLEVFRIAYRHSMYLFNSEVQNYLKGIDSKIGSLERIELDVKREGSDQETHKKEKEAIIEWLRKQRPGHERKFERFMTLNKI